MRWVVQSNLGNSDVFKDLYRATRNCGVEFEGIKVIPFSDELPDIPTDEPTVFYGATRWINTIWKSGKWSPGVFFNPESVVPYWNTKYQKLSLNYRSEVTTLYQLSQTKIKDDEKRFIRPVSDHKDFSGMVISGKDLRHWTDLLSGDTAYLGSLPIIQAPVRDIACEWRLFMLEGRVIAASQYRVHGRLAIDEIVPEEVKTFAKTATRLYEPHPLFVMDIGEYDGELYVIEVGCFNSAGFYACDIKKIVREVSAYAIEVGQWKLE